MTQENDINILNAEIRKKFNKYNSKHDRDNGRIPAVLYDSENNIYVTLNEKEVAQWYKKSFAEYNKLYINLEDKKILVVPKIVDTNKVTDNVSHIEFQILHDKKYVFNVPILYDQLSQSPGIKNRGTLIIVNKTIKITCLPKDLPSYIIYDSKNVMVNQKIYISDIVLPKEITIKQKNIIIATCIGSRIKEETETSEEQENTTN